MTGHRIQLPKSVKLKAGKITRKPGLMAWAKRRKADRLAKAWRGKSK